MWVGTHGELALGERDTPPFPMSSNSLPKLFTLTPSNMLCNFPNDFTRFELCSPKHEVNVESQTLIDNL